MGIREKLNIGIDGLLKLAFSYWSSTILYQLLFSMIYLSIMLMVVMLVGERYGIIEQYFAIADKTNGDFVAMQEEIVMMQQSSAFMKFSMYVLGAVVFLFPLSIGLFAIYKKKDNGEKIVVNDLFSGYLGLNFLKFTSFYLFWFIIYSYTLPTFILAFVWIMVTLFAGPLMFFQKKSIFETISLTFAALKRYFLEIMVCVLVGFLFKYAGIMVFFFGFILTYPFMTAMIYALYSKIFIENEN